MSSPTALPSLFDPPDDEKVIPADQAASEDLLPASSECQIALIAGLGLVGFGCLLSHLSASWLSVPGILSILVTWTGTSILFIMALAMTRRRQQGRTRVNKSSRTTEHRPPQEQAREILEELGRQTQSRAALLLEPGTDRLRYKLGWGISDPVGWKIAEQVCGRASMATQSLTDLTVLDRAFSAVCLPIKLKKGYTHLLVLMLDSVSVAEAAGKAHIAMSHARRLSDVLNEWTHCLQSTPFRVATTSEHPACCAFCDRLALSDQHWVPWNEWLFKTQGMSFSHTLCDDCAGSLYASSEQPEAQEACAA